MDRAKLESRLRKVMEIGKMLKGPDQIMTILCEFDPATLTMMEQILEVEVNKNGKTEYELFFSWIRFVRYMKRLNHLNELSWERQRPEYYKPN